MINESGAQRLAVQRKSPIIFHHAIIAECCVSGSNRQAHNLKIWTVSLDLPWIPSRVRLSVEPALYAYSQTARGKELPWGNQHWNDSLCAAHSTCDECPWALIGTKYTIQTSLNLSLWNTPENLSKSYPRITQDEYLNSLCATLDRQGLMGNAHLIHWLRWYTDINSGLSHLIQYYRLIGQFGLDIFWSNFLFVTFLLWRVSILQHSLKIINFHFIFIYLNIL